MLKIKGLFPLLVYPSYSLQQQLECNAKNELTECLVEQPEVEFTYLFPQTLNGNIISWLSAAVAKIY